MSTLGGRGLRRGALLVAAVIALGGCGVSRERFDAQVLKTHQERLRYEQERERAERLQAELLQVLRTTEVLLEEKERLQARVGTLEQSLAEAEAARRELMELNANLAGQRARLSTLTEQISTTWYDSALERALRALVDEAAAPAAPKAPGVAH